MSTELISIKDLREEIKRGEVRLAGFHSPVKDGIKNSIYLIEMTDNLLAFHVTNHPEGGILLSPFQSSADILNRLMETYVSDSNSTFESNLIFPDDDESLLAEKGEKILDDFVQEANTNDDFILTDNFVVSTDKFFDLAFIEVYNKLIKIEGFPVDQVIDIEFKVDTTKQFIPKFHIFYKRVISCGDERPFTEMLGKTSIFTRNPKDFTMISAVMTDRYKSGYIEFLLELYTKVRYIRYMQWVHCSCTSIVRAIEEYQSYI